MAYKLAILALALLLSGCGPKVPESYPFKVIDESHAPVELKTDVTFGKQPPPESHPQTGVSINNYISEAAKEAYEAAQKPKPPVGIPLDSPGLITVQPVDRLGNVYANVAKISPEVLEQIRDACKGK